MAQSSEDPGRCSKSPSSQSQTTYSPKPLVLNNAKEERATVNQEHEKPKTASLIHRGHLRKPRPSYAQSTHPLKPNKEPSETRNTKTQSRKSHPASPPACSKKKKSKNRPRRLFHKHHFLTKAFRSTAQIMLKK